ncbi:unnamed protein product [Periconia digitata]|uniref:Uncharacterized protein n=1 Tax=Periconia digitata TaxID=1303443 RepID=A0A9W4UT69_9PLEO|nr:unnamed protein product [Periconia digitata]
MAAQLEGLQSLCAHITGSADNYTRIVLLRLRLDVEYMGTYSCTVVRCLPLGKNLSLDK